MMKIGTVSEEESSVVLSCARVVPEGFEVCLVTAGTKFGAAV